MQEEKKLNIDTQVEKKDEKPKQILKSALEKYPFKIKKKMSNKEVRIKYFHWIFINYKTDFSTVSV